MNKTLLLSIHDNIELLNQVLARAIITWADKNMPVPLWG